MKTLGLDLGTNSLGWSLNSDNSIEGAGVLTFSEGIKREKGVDSLETPAAERRKYRMGRRLKFRRRMRKQHLLRILIANGMCPLSETELNAWKQSGHYPVENAVFRAWLRNAGDANPYRARALAAENPIPKEDLGRAFYHLAQRRGFKSSRKDLMKEAEDPKAAEKAFGPVKKAIAELTRKIEDGQFGTLGRYFYFCYQNGEKIRTRYTSRDEHYVKEFEAICRVQKLPEDLQENLHKALFFQRPLRPQTHLIGKCPLEKRQNRCHGAHPLYEAYRMWSFINTIRVIEPSGNQRPLAGEERRLASEAFYKKVRYIAFDEIEKKIGGKKSTLQFNYPSKKTIPASVVTHQLNTILGMNCLDWVYTHIREDGKTVTYDYQALFDALLFFNDDKMLIDFAQKRFGLTADQAEKLSARNFLFPESYARYSLCAIRKILPHVVEGCDLWLALLLAKLPDLIGQDTFAAHAQQIRADIQERHQAYRDNKALHARDPKIGLLSLEDRLFHYFSDKWRLTPEQWDRRYRYTQSDYPAEAAEAGILPPVHLGMLRNPLVQRSLTHLRKFVNYLRRQGKIDANTRIHIELARSVNDRNTRIAWSNWQKKLEDDRMKARERVKEIRGVENPSDDDILRYLLWQEQGEDCLYSGARISAHQLFDGSVDIEHTIPRSRSGDDSTANKTLCFATFNRQEKRGKMPSECHNYDDIQIRIHPWQKKLEHLEKTCTDQFNAAKKVPADNPDLKGQRRQEALLTQFERDYWRKKISYFTKTAEDLANDSGFSNRQLVDTGIITRQAVALLRSVYPATYPVNGTAVEWARKAWGVQQTHQKSRDSHTHHAIDAMVIAALGRNEFNTICAFYKDDADLARQYGDNGAKVSVPPPFEGFSDTVRQIADSLLVRHLPLHKELKQTHRNNHRLAKSVTTSSGHRIAAVATTGDTVRGGLHNDTFYGKIQPPPSKENPSDLRYVVRKALASENFETLEKLDAIVDPAVCETIKNQIITYMNQNPDLKFKKILDDPDYPIWMRPPNPQENIPGIPIKKVRIYADSVANPRELKPHSHPSPHAHKNPYYVMSAKGTNFRVALYREPGKNGKEKVTLSIENLFDWAKEHKDPASPFHQGTPKKAGFKGYLAPGQHALTYENTIDELKTLPPKELGKRLYRIVKFEGENTRIKFSLHSEARTDNQLLDAKFNKNGESEIDFEKPHPKLLLSNKTYAKNMCFEGIDFTFTPDGRICFLE